eukprot:3106868-Rhodomonas_salina.1
MPLHLTKGVYSTTYSVSSTYTMCLFNSHKTSFQLTYDVSSMRTGGTLDSRLSRRQRDDARE